MTRTQIHVSEVLLLANETGWDVDPYQGPIWDAHDRTWRLPILHRDGTRKLVTRLREVEDIIDQTQGDKF